MSMLFFKMSYFLSGRNDKRQITLPSRGAIKTLSGSYYIANIQQFLYSAIFLLIFFIS